MKGEPGPTVAVIGASARAAAFSLLRAGCAVVTADLFADADLAQQCPTTRIAPYPEGFDEWLPETLCDAWLYTGALENHPTLIDRLAASRQLAGHRGDTLRRVRDPLQLQAALTRAKLHFPQTRVAEEPTQSNHWLRKTYRGSCGSGVGSTDGAAFLQRRMDGLPLSAVYIGSQLIGVTRQLVGEAWAGAHEFQYCGTISPWPVPLETLQQLERLATVLHDEFALTDVYGIDFILDGNAAWTLEVNPRYTAAVEVVERVHGISVFAAASDSQSTVASGVRRAIPRIAPGIRRSVGNDVDASGKVILYAKAPVTISPAMSRSLLQQAGALPWPEIADIPTAGSEILVGQPILTLFAAGETCENVHQQLQQRVADVEKELYRKA